MFSKKKNKVLFLDRDGVINVDTGYVYKIDGYEFFPDTISALKTATQMGYKIVIVTNQSGIARGKFTVKDYKKLTRYYLSIFKKNGIVPLAVYYCPHHKDGIRKSSVFLFNRNRRRLTL